MITAYFPYILTAILLVAVVVELRTGRIPNWLVALPLLLFIVTLIMADDRAALLPQIYFAIGMFVAGLLLFAFGGFAAGAVKLMTAVVLFIPWAEAGETLAVFVVALFGCTALIVPLRKVLASDESSWHVLQKPVLPLTLPICIAALASLFWF